METQLLHIFRNTPLGRETLMQSIYFCKKIGTNLVIYIPEFTKFLMYFENDVVQVNLDASYLTAPENAIDHVLELAEASGLSPHFYKPKHFTASVLPDVPIHFSFMTCPRSVSDQTSKIGLGHIGAKVRRIVASARFPVLITSPVYKEWKSIAVFFGGSANALNAVRLGLRLTRITGLPLDVFTQIEKMSQKEYRDIIDNEELGADVDRLARNWFFFKSKNDGGRSFEENLYRVPHDALVVLGAYGHGRVKDIIFGSKMEVMQATLQNNLLVAGPNYSRPFKIDFSFEE